MRRVVLPSVAAFFLAHSAQAEVSGHGTNAWFDAGIESYWTWPTNDVAAFGGTWSNVDSARLSPSGLAVAAPDDAPLVFAASECRSVQDGELLFSGEIDMDSFSSLPVIAPDAKAGVCVVDSPDGQATWRVLARDSVSLTNNVWLDTGIAHSARTHFMVRAGAADAGRPGCLKVEYSFGNGASVATHVFVGGTQEVAGSLSFMGGGTLSALSGSSISGLDSGEDKTVSGGGDALQKAIDAAHDGDTIFVAAGVYSPISTGGRRISVVGVDGAEKTFIDGSLAGEGEGAVRCATLGSTTNAVLRGFTLLNGGAADGYGGGAYYGTLEDCVVSNCTARCGGGTGYSALKRCVVKGNFASWLGGGTYYGTTESTLIAGNSTTNRCGGAYYGTHVNATIAGNTAAVAPGGVMYGTIRNTVSYGNSASSGNSAYFNVTNTTCEYSCVSPSQSGTGNINSNPQFADATAGDYSPLSTSPCIDRGWKYLPLDATDIAGNPRHRGARTDIGAFELQQGADRTDNATLYVSGGAGNDANDGFSWSAPFKTIQAAVEAAFAGDRIVVTNGTYSAITTHGKAIRIESVNGASVTTIDGGNSSRCATLGSTTSDKSSVLSGFTLYRGRASSANGGGAIYGTLLDCVISNCNAVTSGYCGGGSYYTDAVRCTYYGNAATYGYGGGAYGGTLSGCAFTGNSAYYGGGTGYGTVSNCTYSANRATSYYGGGAYYGTLYDCAVSGNTSSNSGGGTYGSTLYRCEVAGNRSTSYYGGGSFGGTLYECVVSNNTAVTLGGGVNGSTMYNCLVVRNGTTGSSSSGGGVQGGWAYNCTIVYNSAPYRGGMQGGYAYNCIVWGNTETRQTSNYANVSNTVCRATCTSPLQTNDVNNIAGAPLFADEAGGNYRVSADSPCCDAGLNSLGLRATDLDGNFRVSNRRVDMGAYECQQSASTDGRKTTWHVDGATGDDDADGLTEETAFRTIDGAALGAAPGDTILVAPGVYPPIRTYSAPVRIESVGGASQTVIDASLAWADGTTNRCATLYEGYGAVSNTTLVGFTLANGRIPGYGGGSYGGTLVDCVVSNCTAMIGGGCYLGYVYGCRIIGNTATTGGGAANCTVIDRSLVSGNYARSNGGGTSGGSRIVNSIIAGNGAGNWGGGMYYGQEVFNCTITANRAAKGGGIYSPSYPRAYNSIIWGNTLSDCVTTDNWAARRPMAYFYSCCTTPLPETGPVAGTIETDPFLCRFPDGTYRIPASSPCVDAGDEEWLYRYGSYYAISTDADYLGNGRRQGANVDMGAIEGGFDGVVVSTSCEGAGVISDSVSCNPGDSITVGVARRDTLHGLVGIFVDGVDATESAVATNGVYLLALTPTNNTSVTARFAAASIYVSPQGNDAANDGSSWESAKMTIQGAIDASAANDVIVVTNGTYGAISMLQNYTLTIRSVEGRDATAIDGGGLTRCATLGTESNSATATNVTLYGFTLQNGFASTGGGAWDGRLVDCRVTGCMASSSGGGTYYTDLERCILDGNSATNDMGGGTYYGTLRNCLVIGNYAKSNGGGTYYSHLYNCTVASNRTAATGSSVGGGAYGNSAYNSIIWGNSGGVNSYSVSLYASNDGVDPQFTTVDGNPWALTMSSPCLDAGTNTYASGETDLAGNPRIQNGTVDMGCFEMASQTNIALTSVTVANGTYTYRGTAWTPAVTVRAGDGTLRAGEHYTLVWFDNTDAGTATVVATGVGPVFAGSVTNTFTIVPKTIAPSMFTVPAAYPFTGEAVCPPVAVTESTLTTNDWSAAYANNIAPGMATVTLTGRRNYAGTASRTFYVSSAALYVSTSGDDAAFGVSADAPKRSLQAAVEAAFDGTVIYVDDGVYAPIVTSNKAMEIRSLNGWAKAIIDGGGTNRCVYAGEGSAGTNTKFHGFTIRNGRVSNGYGGGARGGTFYNCVFSGNVQVGSSYAGGATSGSTLYNCLLTGNSAYDGGGANAGTIVNCTIVGNTASRSGGGVLNATSRNTIVWDNYCPNSYSNHNGCAFTYSCTAPAVSGTGNICSNPYFTSPSDGDWRLRQYSPCLDSGNNSFAAGDSDLQGTNRVIDATVDMGAYEGWTYLPSPAQVAGFSAEKGRRIGAVRLVWTADGYARTYTVCRSETEDFSRYSEIASTTASFFDDDTAQPETTYWYRVYGVNPAGTGAASAADSGWCLGEMAFGTNVLPTATAGLYYSTQLEITGGSGRYAWKSGADDYDVVQGESTYLVSDLVSTGVSGDDNCLSYPLPFDFPFFGNSYNKVWVSSNGTLSFDSSMTDYSTSLDFFKSRVMIAAMWKDLRTGSGGVGVSTNGGESITFFWNDASYYSGGGSVNASVTLYSDGTVLCSYGGGNASGAFVGVSAGDGIHFRYFNLAGTSLANYDDIRFVPQDVPGGLALAPDGSLFGVAAAPGTYTFTVFVTDSYGNGATQMITLEVESNPNLRTVQFDLGAYGVRGGGGDLLQYVMLGESATAPSVRSRSGWVFDGWNRPFTNISENITVSANYRSAYADLHVDEIDVTNSVASGETLNLRWIVGNTGNPSFSGRMTERVSLVSVSNSNDVRVIASPVFEGSIARDGSVERNLAVNVPLKGWEGAWRVRIETAINPNMQEYAANNVTTTDATLEITAVPLPNLKVNVPGCDALLVPGETAAFSFTTTNSGAAAASAPWTDRVYLESVDSGEAVKVGDISRTNDLNPASAINGEYALTIPEFISVAGAVRVKVVADANGDVVELDDDDNVAYSAETLSLATNLYLTAASTSVYENVSGSGVRFTVRRSGQTTEALTVELAVAGGSPSSATVTCPESVTIPAGSVSTVFYVKPIDNATVEGSRTITVSASSVDCRPASLALTILDNEVPKLAVTLDKTTIREGDGVILATVTRELVTDEPLTVYLTGASTSRCSYPSFVVIPAGVASVTFEISVPDNETAQAEASLTLRASSSGYASTAVTYTVEDDDVPGVTLSLSPEVVSEGAGAQAIYATLTRSDTNQIDQAVRVRLTASEANQLILPSEITLPKYTRAVRFAIGVVDNALDDGDREIDIDGAIVIESCGCNGQSSNGDVIHATVGVIDNDGPALALKADPATMKEGFDPAGYLVLSHNSTLEEDLTVRLWVDAGSEDEIVIPETVTIPAGETSVRVPVRTLDDGVEDGGQLVSVYAEDESDVFAPASTWVQVSDQNLPDLKVEGINLPTSVSAGNAFEVEFVTLNAGFVRASSGVEYSVHLVGGSRGDSASAANKVGGGRIASVIATNETIATSLTVTSPTKTGEYRIVVVLDPDGRISELDDANNSLKSDPIAVSAAYTANVTVADNVYLQGSRIPFSGTAVMPDGITPAANQPIDLYVLVDGMRRTFNLTTDASGAFSMMFQPTATEAGRYTIGACYPGESTTVAQDHFDILGMKLGSTSAITCQLGLGDSGTRSVTIKNRSKTPLTGLKVALSNDLEEVWDISTSLPDALPGDGTVTFRLTATAIGLSPVNGSWDVIPVEITSDEGASLSFEVRLYSQAQQAQLAISPALVNTKMTIGEQRYFEFTVSNNGRGDSGRIGVNLPTAEWLRSVTATTIDNLKGGETATITLEVYPKDEHNLVLNKPLTGTMGVSCANGTGANATLKFTPVYDATGAIKVDVWDNAYYNQTDGSHPHLAGATVRLSNVYDNNRVIASGTTDDSGIWTADEIPVGEYQLWLTADKHDSVGTNVVINPGQTTVVERFLKNNLVTQTWDVKKTEIEDQYEITMLLDFDTHVPSSKVEMTLPDEFPVLNEGESWTFAVHVVNSGLIQAENVTVTMPEIPGHSFIMSENDFTLPAKSSKDISVVMKRDRYPAKMSGDLKMQLTLPDSYEQGDTVTATISYENTGASAMPVPIFTLSSQGQEFKTEYATYTNAVRLIGLGGDDAPGTLVPGERYEIDIPVAINAESKTFTLTALHSLQDSANRDLYLGDFFDEGWIVGHDEKDNETITAIRASFGLTWQEFLEHFSQYIGSLLAPTTDYEECINRFKSDVYYSASKKDVWNDTKAAVETKEAVIEAQETYGQSSTMRSSCSHAVAFSPSSSIRKHIVCDLGEDGDIWQWCTSCKHWVLLFARDDNGEMNKTLDGKAFDATQETYIFCHGNAASIGDVWLADAATHCPDNANVLAINWSDGACKSYGLITGLAGYLWDKLAQYAWSNPYRSAANIPSVVKTACEELRLLRINHSTTTLIGHSHGGHVVANIVNLTGGGDPFARCVGLDTSTTDKWIHSGNAYNPSTWKDITEKCRQVEFYKSSYDMSLEEQDQLYGHYNFGLICKYSEIGDEYKIEDGSGEFMESGSFLMEFARHSSAWAWFVTTMKGGYENLGFNFSGDKSWQILTGGDGQIAVPPKKVFAGVIRNDICELLACRDTKSPWLYDNAFVDFQIRGGQSMSKAMRNLKNSVMATSECSLQMGGTLPDTVKNGGTIIAWTHNHADNLSVPFDDMFKIIPKWKDALSYEHGQVKVWAIDALRLDPDFTPGLTLQQLTNSLASISRIDTRAVVQVGESVGTFALPNFDADPLEIQLKFSNNMFGLDCPLLSGENSKRGVSSRKILLIVGSGNAKIGNFGVNGRLAICASDRDLYPDNNFIWKMVDVDFKSPVSIIEEGVGDDLAQTEKITHTQALTTQKIFLFNDLDNKNTEAKTPVESVDSTVGHSQSRQNIKVVADKESGAWVVAVNGLKSYVEDGELTAYWFTLPDATSKKGAIEFEDGDGFQIRSAVTTIKGELPADVDRETYTVALEVFSLDGLSGTSECTISVIRNSGSDGGIGGGGDSGTTETDGLCWRRVLIGWVERCGENFPVYGYSKYVKHGECSGNSGLVDTINKDNWHDEGSGGGGYVGGPSTGGGGGGGSGGFSGGGGGFNITIDDCDRSSSGDDGSGLTPCQKALLDCGVSVLANFIPGAEYVMAVKDGWDCGTNIREAWGEDGNGFDKFDAVLNCGFTFAGYIPGVGWWTTGASCIYNITKECGFKYSENKASISSQKRMLASVLKAGEDDAAVQTDFDKAASLYAKEIEYSGNWLIELFGSEEWCDLSCDQIRQFLTEVRSSLGSNYELSATALRPKCPDAISSESLERFVNRWNETARASAAGTTLADTDDDAGAAEYIRFDKLIAYSEGLKECNEEAADAGYETAYAYFKKHLDDELAALEANKSAVCASISLKLSQTLTMTREAFEGTLTMYNGHSTVPVTDLILNLSITDEDGNECKSYFVKAGTSTMGAMSSGDILEGGLSLPANSSGSAVITFVPERRAAQDGEKPYTFGGSISYIDPFSGKQQTVPLIGVTLTVSPSPYLKLDYFISRDIYGDDPFTDDMVEASMPAEMAVLVRNTELGGACNVSIASVQPSVFLNEKGLAAEFKMTDFSLDSTALNGSTAHLGLNTVSLGDIPGGESRVAQWWLTSSVDGHFTKMSASVAPLNKWNTPETVLVNPDVGMHKLIRSLEVDGEELPCFLTSEINDLYGAPDTVYSPDGIPHDVTVGSRVTLSGSVAGATPVLTVTVNAESGWNYAYVASEGLTHYTIESVTRADGTSVPLRNVWMTSKVFRDGVVPMLEERLHIADMVELSGETTYTITLAAKPSDVPEVAAFEGVVDGAIEYVTRDSVTVVFSKPIDPATFTVEDLRLMKQGAYLTDLSALTIASADDSGTRFTIGNLSALCGGLGRYELTVQCAGIADTVGQLGTSGKSIAWTYATEESPYIVNVDGVPVRRVRSLDTVTVTLSAPVDPATFTASALRLNGRSVGDYVAVSALDETGTRFIVSGLAASQSSDGEYALTIDASALTSAYGATGTGSRTVTWTRDTVAPVLESLAHEQGLGGSEFIIAFSEEVESASLTPDGATIKRNGESVALPATASLRRVGDEAPCQYVLSGIDSAFAEDGEYELTFSAEGVMDEAGNSASGSRSVTWTVDRTPPAQIADLAISPDGGYSDTDGITYTGVLTVSGTLPEAGLTVEFIAKYAGGGETVLATISADETGGSQSSATALSFSQNVNLPGSGNVTLVVRLTDAAGNSSDTEKNVYVDGIALTGTLTGASEDEGIVTASVVLAFSDKVAEYDVALGKFTLTRDGEAVALEGVTLTKVNDTTFSLAGLDALCAEDGTYMLRFDGSVVRKYTSGLLMSGSPLMMTWRYENPDREPPTVTAVLFDGETPREAYTNVFSTVVVTFSEAVNVPELIENGLIEKAARIDLLDAANVVTGSVLIAEAMTWNGESNALSWHIDPLSVPAGRARLMLDAGLIKDLAGNRLAADGYAATNGMRTYTLADTPLANVTAYAMPTWHDGELYVGEKTADSKGKIRRFVRGGTGGPQFIASGYLQSDGVDIEIPAQGCQGASVAFADMDGDGSEEIYVGTAQGDILKYPGGEAIASLGANRAMPYAYDIDGDERDELVTGGMDGHIRVISRDADSGTYSVSLVSDVNGASLTVPNGRAAPVVADINHDGIADIVSGDTAGNVWAYLGERRDEGIAPYRFIVQPICVFTNNVSLADRSRLGYGDVDVDGIEDIIVGRSDGSVTVMLGAETPSPIVPFAVKAVVSASAGAHGAIVPVGDTTYDGGETPEYVITPDIGYHVADVLVDGIPIGATNSYVFAPLTTSRTISADFAVTPYVITYTGLKGAENPNPATYTVEDAIAFAAPGDVYGWVFKGWSPASIALGTTGAVEVAANWERQKFDVTVNGETRQYDYEEEVTFTAPEPTVDELCKTQFVYVGTSYTAPVATNEFAVSVTNGIEFAWDVIATNYWFETATVQNGSIVAPDAGWMSDGTNFVLEAVPANHYHLAGWAGDTNGCDVAGAQLAVAMNQARTIGAAFAIDTFAVTFAAGAHGTLAGATEQTIDYGATAAVPGVMPDAGYEFTGWNGDVTAPVVGNITFTAQYAVIPYAITYTGLKGVPNPNPATYTVEDAITFAAPGEVYGWTFKGWTPAYIPSGTIGPVEVSASWERRKFDVTVGGETRSFDYEAEAEFAVDAVVNSGATQFVCVGWTAANADPSSGEGARAEFRVLGDVSLDWLWETNVVTLAQSVNAEGLDWTTGGAAEWTPEWSDDANDGRHHAHSGAIGNNANSWIETSVEGAGTLSFVWRTSTEARYDMLQLIVDGEVKGSISGETPWTANTIKLAGGTHTVRWSYRKSRSGTAGADMVWLDSVTWTAEVPPTLAEALNPDLFWTTGGDIEWTAVRKDTILDPHDDWATVGGLADYEASAVETAVYGAGVLTFDWAVSCEDGYDWFDFIADGEIRESITGETGWRSVTVEFADGGRHDLAWEYWKDDMDEDGLVGDNAARLDNVRWTPISESSQYTSTTPAPVPFADIRTAYSNYWFAAEGDYEAAAHATGRNGCAVWQSYVAGLSPDDEDSVFRAGIRMEGGEPVVTWEPDTPELRATRVYTVYGKKTLLDRDWVPVTDANRGECRFFKVEVRLK